MTISILLILVVNPVKTLGHCARRIRDAGENTPSAAVMSATAVANTVTCYHATRVDSRDASSFKRK